MSSVHVPQNQLMISAFFLEAELLQRIPSLSRCFVQYFHDMASFPLARFTVAAAGLMGFGYILMRATVPTEEQLYNEMAPDIRRKVDASRAARLAREQAAARQADVQLSNPDPDAAKPIWANDRNK